jgi:Protein of unknown function (DUF3800)
MTSSFTAYIDESGDEGFVFLPGEKGSSRWLVLSAVVFRKAKDLEAVRVMREVRTLLGKDPKKALHFREMKHEHRVPYVRALAAAPMRTVSVLIHKPSITEPEKFQSEPFRLYRYACRLLVERVSWLCRDTRKDNEGDGSCELIFSNRSAMSYDDLRTYLSHLQDKPGNDARIDWTAIQPKQVRAVNHDQLAGLQMADAVASSLFFAVNLTQYSEVEDRYFKMLRQTIYRHPKSGELGYGLKFWPGSLEAHIESMGHLSSFLPSK